MSLPQVRGQWRRHHAHPAEHEKAPPKQGSIAPDGERSAKDHERLKLGGPMPVSLISHMQVLQSPNEGLVGERAGVSTRYTEQLFISD